MLDQDTGTERAWLWGYLACAIVCLAGYWLTTAHTITWWEGTSWIMAAQTLGVTFPPGSLALTILGGLVSRIPLGIPVPFQLNLFGGVLAVGALGAIWVSSRRIWRSSDAEIDHSLGTLRWFGVIAASCAVLAWGFGWTVWRYANKFTPYMLTAVMTGVLLWAMLRWWQTSDEQSRVRWLALTMLCFGLDFSVHRTNLLLLPGFAVWVALRQPSAYRQLRLWGIALAGLVVGLSAHLGIMALAGRQPLINANDPSNWSRFYDYVSLKQFGGGWLVNLWPRKGDFFGCQLMDFLRAFAATFADPSSPMGMLGLLPCALGIAGAIILARRQAQLAIALVVLFLCSGLGAVIYFNLPTNFPWPMDRHYLPALLIFAVFIVVGALSLAHRISRLAGAKRSVVLAIVTALMATIPVNQWLRNRSTVDQSRDLFAYEFAGNILQSVEPEAIVIVQGDNIWPLWHRNAVEGMRSDVAVYSLSLLNASWYVRQALLRTPPLPVTLTEAETTELGPRPWTEDSIIELTVSEEVRAALRASGVVAGDAVHVPAPPPVFQNFVLAQDWLLVDLLRTNAWKRSVYFVDVPPWLSSHCRAEGLVARLIPNNSVVVDCARLRQLLMRDYAFTAFEAGADGTQGALQWISRSIAQRYVAALDVLARCAEQQGDVETAEAARKRATELFPDVVPTMRFSEASEPGR